MFGRKLNRTRRHAWMRLGGYILGIFLFYAPFALYTRLLKVLLNDPSTSTWHNICLRMPINYLFDPSKWSTFITRPLFLSIFLLLAIAFFFGPLFCGWLCSAGAITEYLGRIVPNRFKLDFSGSVNPTPIRYGFLAGYVLTPFLGGSIACSFCNFSVIQNFVSTFTGEWQALAYWGSTTIITVVVWFVILGVFTKGGRGWCNFGCPVGAVQSLVHMFGVKLPFTYKLKYDRSKCSGCGACVQACSMWAVMHEDEKIKVNRHACINCLDCVQICNCRALTYGKGLAEAGVNVKESSESQAAVS